MGHLAHAAASESGQTQPEPRELLCSSSLLFFLVLKGQSGGMSKSDVPILGQMGCWWWGADDEAKAGEQKSKLQKENEE